MKKNVIMAVAAAALVAGCATADKQGPKNTINQEERQGSLRYRYWYGWFLGQ